MFSLNDIQSKREELEKAIATGKFERTFGESPGILACSCSGTCEGSCDGGCSGGCTGSGCKVS